MKHGYINTNLCIISCMVKQLCIILTIQHVHNFACKLTAWTKG